MHQALPNRGAQDCRDGQARTGMIDVQGRARARRDAYPPDNWLVLFRLTRVVSDGDALRRRSRDVPG